MEKIIAEKPVLKSVSEMAENLISSEIIKLANEVNEKIKKGSKIYNLTIGDFNPNIFPIPEVLKNNIIEAYTENQTNYPPANGLLELRKAISGFLKTKGNVDYKEDQILISGGGRPLIYAVYQALLDPEDTVVFPVPSWNNSHYCHIVSAKPIMLETKGENNFMPTANEIKPYIKDATLIALCSPLNPTGTAFSKEALTDICNLVVEENLTRLNNKKPCYILFDQIYWQLTYGETKHHNPVSLVPQIKDYTIFIDGMSKAFAGTGIRVGWGFGPKLIIDKMKSILSHLGAWSPKAEQVGAARFLNNISETDTYLDEFRLRIQKRLNAFYEGFITLKSMGHNVDAIAPQAAMYLTVKIDLKGFRAENGDLLKDTEDITKYLINEANIALVPFRAFGASKESCWYRLSVGTTSMEDIDGFFSSLRTALGKLS